MLIGSFTCWVDALPLIGSHLAAPRCLACSNVRQASTTHLWVTAVLNISCSLNRANAALDIGSKVHSTKGAYVGGTSTGQAPSTARLQGCTSVYNTKITMSVGREGLVCANAPHCELESSDIFAFGCRWRLTAQRVSCPCVQVRSCPMSAMGTSVGTLCSRTWPGLDSLWVTAPNLMPFLVLSQVWTQA